MKIRFSLYELKPYQILLVTVTVRKTEQVQENLSFSIKHTDIYFQL